MEQKITKKKESDFEGLTMNNPEILYGSPKSLDEKDINLLLLLEQNARTPISKLSRKIGLSRDAIKYRIERLLKQKILLKFTTIANPPNLGFTNISFVMFQLWNLNTKQEESFVKYLTNHPNITYVAKVSGRWDYKIEITAKTPGDFDEIFTTIRRKYPGIIKEHEITTLLKEYKMSYFPYKESVLNQKH